MTLYSDFKQFGTLYLGVFNFFFTFVASKSFRTLGSGVTTVASKAFDFLTVYCYLAILGYLDCFLLFQRPGYYLSFELFCQPVSRKDNKT